MLVYVILTFTLTEAYTVRWVAPTRLFQARIWCLGYNCDEDESGSSQARQKARRPHLADVNV